MSVDDDFVHLVISAWWPAWLVIDEAESFASSREKKVGTVRQTTKNRNTAVATKLPPQLQ